MAPQKTFPSLSLPPDVYPCEWELDGSWIAGEAELQGNRPPTGSAYGEPKGLKAPSRGLPQHLDVGTLVGRLRMGPDVVFGDTELSVWWPDRSIVTARWALAGLRIASVPGQRYGRVRMQVTGFETLFGWAPIAETKWPKDHEAERKEFSFSLVDDHQMHWVHDDVEVDCSYDHSAMVMNPYRYQVVFAPVATVKSASLLSVDEWVNDWIEPIHRLTTFTAGRRQTVAWAKLTLEDPEVANDPRESMKRRRTSQLFGSGISQQPFVAESPPFRTREAPLPLFTLATLSIDFPVLVERWRRLEHEANPFVELYRLVQFTPDLPQRARFLYLIQALEALHSFEHQEHDATLQAEYEALRVDALEWLKRGEAPPNLVARVKDSWRKRRPGSLPDRLRELLAWLSPTARARVESIAKTATASHLASGEEWPTERLLSELRNQLSHGGIRVDDHDLVPWCEALDVMARTHLLRLLRFGKEEIHKAIDRSIET